MYALTWVGWPRSAASWSANSISGGQSRCRPCRTTVLPSANSRSTASEETWSATSAPAPPEGVNRCAAPPGGVDLPGAEGRAVLVHPQNRGPQPPPRPPLVAVVQGLQVGEGPAG